MLRKGEFLTYLQRRGENDLEGILLTSCWHPRLWNICVKAKGDIINID